MKASWRPPPLATAVMICLSTTHGTQSLVPYTLPDACGNTDGLARWLRPRQARARSSTAHPLRGAHAGAPLQIVVGIRGRSTAREPCSSRFAPRVLRAIIPFGRSGGRTGRGCRPTRPRAAWVAPGEAHVPGRVNLAREPRARRVWGSRRRGARHRDPARGEGRHGGHLPCAGECAEWRVIFTPARVPIETKSRGVLG